MPARRLLYLSAHQLTACLWHAGTLSDEGSFDFTEDGRLRFLRYLEGKRKSLFWLLANVADEGFHVEKIPFLRGDDRKAVIARKLGQHFFSATLTASLSLGYEKSRRKDERVLLAALTNNEFFAPWLAALASSGVALAGVHSVSMLGATLLRRLGVADERCLLLTIQDQSIRQSYLEKGQLQFSRLSPLPNSSIGGIAQTFAAEARKLQQYLVSQRLIARQQPIRACLVAHPQAISAIQSTCVDSDTLSFAIFDLEHCAQHSGLATLPTDSRCDRLLLHLLASDPPRSQFANDQQRHGYDLWLVRSALQGAGVVALAACLLWAGKQAYDAHQVNQEVDLLVSETALARRRYDEIVRTFPPIATSNDNLRRVIDRYLEVERSAGSPDYLWRELGRALGVAPAIELDALDWKLMPAPAPASRSLVGGDGKGRAPAAPGDETLVVRGSIRLGDDSNPRQVLAVFNRFLDALRRNPQLEVEVQQQPFDVESGKALKGGDAAAGERQPRAFRLQLRRVSGA
ncbi:hypothetical protein [Accumulibacter sp.]|uniref:hypothetical protein n=1 Tax=Accumulibacter sp. TaxID=2053492 RepID=UPI0025D43F54|nr:hypothetical protein [Accumulibacter sp.]MCM8613352.1 hypothetical protein [Accumulibacter sp.]MCM8636999.1 hypothetical protein [Accumulibacter sp.]MCM8641879.1 hypothetical protein [Accumulibacter sp.]